MKIRGSWTITAYGIVLAVTCITGCTADSRPPTSDEKRAAHLDRVRETYRLGRVAGLEVQEGKIADGTPPASASPSEAECLARWTQLGEHEQTSGDKAGFLAACSSFPSPGLPGYDEAVAEARGAR
ncbi:hypothetical protein [Streptomyces sp. NPDC056891]|uniref:hypothetical protein n=1 Tax=unclassified Streptomyces TaxID=2593676 RepID=UPI0036BDA79A